MRDRKWEARPGLQATGRATDGGRGVGSTSATYSSTGEPVALAVVKRGRTCIVAKVTYLGREPVLAIAHKRQHGVQKAISLPPAGMEYGEQAGCRWLYFRRDTTGQMWRLPLDELRKVGWLKTSCGRAEWFCPIASMELVPWQNWPFAKRVVVLQDEPDEDPGGQLSLFGEGA